MTQLYSNNAETTLSALLTISATSATLTDGSLFRSPAAGEFELLTLIDDDGSEIVSVTARSLNEVTIQRAQEGTVAREWAAGTRVFAGITAATLAKNESALVNIATDSNSIAVKADSADGEDSIAIGHESHCDAIRSVVIGHNANADKLPDGPEALGLSVIGRNAQAAGWNSTSVGNGARCDDDNGVAVGGDAWSPNPGGTSIGKSSYAEAQHGTAVGHWSYAGGDESVAVGHNAEAHEAGAVAIGEMTTWNEHVAHISALWAVPSAGMPWDSEASAAYKLSAPSVTIMSELISFKNLRTYTITIPEFVSFFPEEVGVIVSSGNTVTVQPTVRFGITGDEERYINAVQTSGLLAENDRARFVSLKTFGGATNLRAEITTDATATELTGRFYWRGFAVVDDWSEL